MIECIFSSASSDAVTQSSLLCLSTSVPYGRYCIVSLALWPWNFDLCVIYLQLFFVRRIVACFRQSVHACCLWWRWRWRHPLLWVCIVLYHGDEFHFQIIIQFKVSLLPFTCMCLITGLIVCLKQWVTLLDTDDCNWCIINTEWCSNQSYLAFCRHLFAVA